MFPHRHVGEQPDVLKGAHDSGPRDAVRRLVGDSLAIEHDGAGRSAIGAGDDVEGRGLAGAIRADHADDLARRNLKRKAGQSVDAAEQLGDAIKLQTRQSFHRRAHAGDEGNAKRSSARSSRPWRRTSSMPIRSAPNAAKRQSARNRRYSGSTTRITAPASAPGATVEPPRMTASTKSIERSNEKFPGSM